MDIQLKEQLFVRLGALQFMDGVICYSHKLADIEVLIINWLKSVENTIKNY